MSGAELVFPLSGSASWLDEMSLKRLLSQIAGTGQVANMAFNATGTYVVKGQNYYAVVKIDNIKPEDKFLYLATRFKLPEGISFEQFLNDLRNTKSYKINAIFVAKKPQWVPAQDPKTGEILNAAYFRYAEHGRNQIGEPVVLVHFNEKGKQIFCDISTAYVGKQMAIAVGGKIVTAPVIREPICGGTAQISGGFSEEEAKKMAQDLNEGAMPAQLILVSEEKISPTL